jgi:hypothetical protein
LRRTDERSANEMRFDGMTQIKLVYNSQLEYYEHGDESYVSIAAANFITQLITINS